MEVGGMGLIKREACMWACGVDVGGRLGVSWKRGVGGRLEVWVYAVEVGAASLNPEWRPLKVSRVAAMFLQVLGIKP